MPRSTTERNAEIAFEVGRKIRMYRSKRGISQEKLAALADVTFGSLNRAELGKAVPSLETLERLASVLGVKLRDLVPDGPRGSMGSAAGNGYFTHTDADLPVLELDADTPRKESALAGVSTARVLAA